jgi:hypothetical protein
MAGEKVSIEGVSPKGRLSYPSLWVPRENDSGKSTFEAVLIFPKETDISALRRNIVTAVTNEWGAGGVELLKAGKLDLALKATTDKQVEQGYFEGGYYARFKRYASSDRKNSPYKFDVDGRLLSQDNGELYGGCWAVVNYDVFCWTKLGRQGVSFGLTAIRKVADDQRFGGGPPAADAVAKKFAEAGYDTSLPTDLAEDLIGDIPF